MSIRTIFDTCRPRADVLRGTVAEADFAADLAQVVTGEGSAEYVDAARFFANTYPTRGLKNLLANVCRRLSGAGGEAAAIFRLDTSYGGGKTHGLIALAHAARGLTGVAGVQEFIDPALRPQGPVRLAAFDGENADPANGRTMGQGVRARTPWGEIAYALAGAAGYERVKNSDAGGISPGADTLRELFGGQPTLILLDELSVYLRKVRQIGAAGDQLTAFLTSLFKAVEGTPHAALVYTLAIGKEGRAVDAYSAENQFIADRMAEAESVSARKATLLNPTEEDETAQVLRRRLFESIDEDAAREAVDAYQAAWSAKRDAIADDASRPETAECFRASWPLHPEVLQTLTSKTATLETFQRVRGMLRLLARTIGRLWETRPADATAIHLHHVDPGCEPIRQEIVTRLQQSRYVPAIANDVAGSGGTPALAQHLDAKHHGGMPPYATYVARTIFMHTLAFNDPLKGLSPEQLRYSMLGPSSDVSFIEEARKLDHIEDGAVDVVVMDPPYFDNVMYAELSDFFYVWLKRTAGHVFPELFRRKLTDKENEAVANPARFAGQPGAKALAGRYYQQRMAAIFAECRRVLKSDGVMTLMFTHKATGAWDALTTGLIEAGFVITASWPVNTEAEGSLHIKGQGGGQQYHLPGLPAPRVRPLVRLDGCRPSARSPPDVRRHPHGVLGGGGARRRPGRPLTSGRVPGGGNHRGGPVPGVLRAGA